MDDLKFPDWSGIPPQKNRRLSFDEYLQFVLFMRETFPPKPGEYRQMPASARFVIREDDTLFGGPGRPRTSPS